MINLSDIQVEGGRRWYLSLKKLTGLEIVDIHVSISGEFGDNVIQLDYVVFSDGTKLECAGEHDIAFFYMDNPLPNCDNETLDSIYEQVEESL